MMICGLDSGVSACWFYIVAVRTGCHKAGLALLFQSLSGAVFSARTRLLWTLQSHIHQAVPVAMHTSLAVAGIQKRESRHRGRLSRFNLIEAIEELNLERVAGIEPA
jgi:hypothetical protein